MISTLDKVGVMVAVLHVCSTMIKEMTIIVSSTRNLFAT